MASNFTERSELERGFAAVYGSRIAPRLHLLQAERARLAARTRRAFTLAALAALVASFASILLLGLAAGGALAGAVAISVGIAVFTLAARRSDAYARALQDLVLDAIAEFLDLRLRTEGVDDTLLLPFMRLGLVQPAGRRRLSHQLTGSYRGTRFYAMAARIENLSRSNRGDGRLRRLKVFGGLLLSIEAPIRAQAPIFILPRRSEFAELLADAFDATPRQPPPEIAVEDEAFAAWFTAHGADEREARRFLTPALLRALPLIEEERAQGPQLQGWPNGRISAAFAGDASHRHAAPRLPRAGLDHR